MLSIVKRRGSLGVLGHNDDEERFTKSRSELLSLIRIAFGGMVAEELDLGESTTGPLSDLTEATKIAAMMVGALGMGGSLVSFSTGIPGEDLIRRVLEDKPSRAATESILDQAKADVTQLLQQHRVIHRALRDALLEREELVGEEILEVVREAILRDKLAEIDLREPVVETATAEEGQVPQAPL